MNNNNLFLNYVLIVRYGELILKGKNRNNFIKILDENIKVVLRNFNFSSKIHYDHIEITNFGINQLKNIINVLKLVPGISVINVGFKLTKDLDLLNQCVYLSLDEPKTFKLECSRKDKSYHLNSMQVIKHVSKYLLETNDNLKVDLHNPQQKITIEINKHYFLVFVKKIIGVNGLPVGSSGKALVLLSGGIDSPVAAYMLMCRGLHVDFLTFITPPHTKEGALDKTKQLARIITLNGSLCDSKLYVSNFSPIVKELAHIEPQSYKIIMLRRCFLKQAARLASQHKYDAIATGDSLGQVASQTIASLNIISQATPELLILRPLIGIDKMKIIELAKQINTYDISILPFADACSLFVPKNPITMPKLPIVNKIEQQLYYIDILINKITRDNLQVFDVRGL